MHSKGYSTQSVCTTYMIHVHVRMSLCYHTNQFKLRHQKADVHCTENDVINKSDLWISLKLTAFFFDLAVFP